ncbi:MAG: hypothetical protein QOC87_287 [Actinomycetota bacterium]|nr:hypothetical protein [Actinomycetota bacterium]
MALHERSIAINKRSIAIKKGVACAVACAALLTSSTSAIAASPQKRAALGTRYVVTRQHKNGSFPGFSALGATADAVLSLAAAARGQGAIDKAIAYLKANVDSASLGQKAKIALAAVAAGKDPRSFGGHNLLKEIKASQKPSGRYAEKGDFTAVITHSLAMIALEAGGAKASAKAQMWLRDAQCPDGGWQYDGPRHKGENRHCFDAKSGNDFSTTDTNTTSYGVQALVATHTHLAFKTNPFKYFASARDDLGGWRYSYKRSSGGATTYMDANSTALVLQAFAAEGKALPGRGIRALEKLQYRKCGSLEGAFARTWEKRGGKLHRSPSIKDAKAEKSADGPTVIGATVGAIPGLLGDPLPISHTTTTTAPPARKSC